MRLFCDLETFSECPIKFGSHRYAEDPTTEILLWGYAIDDAPAKVWDCTSQPTMPDDLREAVARVQGGDGTVVFHNGMNFDTVVLERKGWPFPLESIVDTMVMAYQHGLPGALADLSVIYRLDKDHAKDTDGSRLVNLFCKPLPKGRKFYRATKDTHPEDWQKFVNYCRLDIEAERSLWRLLPRFNCTPAEHNLQVLDARINRRGMQMDVDLAQAAVELSADEDRRLKRRTKELTGGALDSATRTQALIDTIRSQYGVDLKNLQKSEVARLAEDATLPEPLRELLRVRLGAAKASIKKFQSVLDCVNKDGRLRGCLQFRGASRTGRWCLTGDHEVLTPSGWMRLDEWKGGRIAVWNAASEALSFQSSDAVSFPYAGEMYHYESARCDQVSTPDHKMPYLDRSGRWASDTVEHLAHKRIAIPFTGARRAPATLEHDLLRVVIMTQADGSYTVDGQLNFRFKKERKVQRCKMLLRRSGISFVYDALSDGVHRISVHSRDLPLWLRIFRDKHYGTWLFNESADVIFDELPEWDGSRSGPNSIQYSTSVKANADLIQALAALSGRYATLLEKKTQHDGWAKQYVVNIWNTPGKSHTLPPPSIESFEGTVYCASTPTGFFLVRRNGKVWVTGNSGRLFQPQNIARPSMSDDDIRLAIACAKARDMDFFFGDRVGEALSNCLRGEIIVPPGKKLVVADYSNIEGRVLAWEAGEQWKLDAFRAYDAGTGPDLYKLTYSKAFNVPVETVTKAQRQMGKVLELAMGYGGGPGAFVTFARGYGIDLHGMAKAVLPVVPRAVLDEAVKSYEWAASQPERLAGLERDVWIASDSVKRLWRRANPHIVAFWSETERACLMALNQKNSDWFGPRHSMRVFKKGAWLLIRLPSGRFLCYPAPVLGDDTCAFTYMGVNQYTRKWERIKTYGAKVVENLTQAIAADILANALPWLERAGYLPILTVHDEVLTEAPDDPKFCHEKLEAEMCKLPKWGRGLPLAAAGFDDYRYRK